MQSVEVLIRSTFPLVSTIVSKKARTASKEAPIVSIKLPNTTVSKKSTVSRKLPTVSKKPLPYFSLIFAGRVPSKHPPGKSPAKISKMSIPDNFLQAGHSKKLQSEEEDPLE